ncbi:ABC transporter ATP-binding protein [Anaerobacillus isosaccharinicus]|uniref:ATP-binding cassette domain-containing protein n=1 Tax=Anaerobacillus isosaccharinicus TaxID=1532552 RepID=A0A1S2KUM6_9BACI|nr:ABC transporter transmembrane domain-containing protein [Anaerobacillus isosaccharinicus]MBA5585275.1 ATP-binding cassette domain-containing protein [Anaerobacillus isosaccharinicus]QOY36395.1 ATP-binding cassette domain-containing protein [Anaerobacillus isosaccharinicus]
MFSVLRKLSWFFKENWLQYTIAITFLCLVSLLEVIPPKLIGISIDSIHQGTLTMERLIQLLLIFGLITLMMYAFSYVWLNKLFGGAFLLERTYRSKIMHHLLKMTPTFFEKNRTGDLMARATNDLKAVSMTAGFGILTLVDSTIYLFIILLTMGFLVSWKLTIAALLPLPIMALLMKVYGKVIHERFTKAQDAFGNMNDQVLESIAGVRVVRAYVQEGPDQKRFKDVTDDVLQKNISVAKIDALFDPTIKVLVGLSYLIGLGYGAFLVFHNEITLGELVTFNIYLGMLIWPMFAIGELINIMQRGNASLDRVSETLTYEPDVPEGSALVTIEKPETISFSNVTFRYPSSQTDNLRHIHFSLQPGQTLGVVGKTGSGKTTLLKQLLREYPIGSGAITISGVSLEQIDMNTLKSWIGYVPQEQILFSRTIKENILFGREDASEHELYRVLELSSFKNDVATLPLGLETLVGEKGVSLSGGQKQRISIARALLVNPEILILDDAMSAVDGKTESQIIDNIRRERGGKTTFISTHRLSAVKHAVCIFVLEDGEVVEEGTHEQLINNNGWYKQQYEHQLLEASTNEGQVN